MLFTSVNPTTGKKIKTYPQTSTEELVTILEKMDQEFLAWKAATFKERSAVIKRAGTLLRERKQNLGRLMTDEMGKPIKQSESEIEKCAWTCDFFAEEGERFLADEIIQTDASRSFITFQPLGVILAIMPWNFPFWQVFRHAAPSLIAGNALLLKHASNVSGCALAIETLLHDAGVPRNLFRAVFSDHTQISAVIDHPVVRAVTLTGSTPAGASVAAQAGRALKKVVLELGGSDPYIILEDANLESTVETCVNSRLLNAGQSCVAAKRFVVVKQIQKKFEERFVELMKSKKMGDPVDPGNDIGPLARFDLRDALHAQVTKSIEMRAKCLLGGKIPNGEGAFYPPTVLTNVRKGSPSYKEELFGPVAAIISAKDEADAIRIANDSPFGLGAAIFTADSARGEKIAAEQLEAGCCFVNTLVKSDPRLPFGGIKQSGFGRELSHYGIKEFMNIKTVYVK